MKNAFALLPTHAPHVSNLHTHLIHTHTHPRAHTQAHTPYFLTPGLWWSMPGLASLLLKSHVSSNKPPSKAASHHMLFRTGWTHPRKSCFLCILTETALKGEMGIQRCQLQYSPISSPIRPGRDLPSLWINCIFQGLIKLSWASAWRGTNWHLQRFLKPAVDITVPAAFSCIDPMPDLWNPWWLLTLEAYWSFPRELRDSLCSQVQLPIPPGEPISSQRAGAEQMFCMWFRILKKKGEKKTKRLCSIWFFCS